MYAVWGKNKLVFSVILGLHLVNPVLTIVSPLHRRMVADIDPVLKYYTTNLLYLASIEGCRQYLASKVEIVQDPTVGRTAIPKPDKHLYALVGPADDKTVCVVLQSGTQTYDLMMIAGVRYITSFQVQMR